VFCLFSFLDSRLRGNDGVVAMLKKIINRVSSVNEAAIVLAIASLVSRLFGVVRDSIIAAHYAGDVSDAYLAAFTIPDFVFNLVILGALSSAFIPIFTEYLNKNGEDKEEAWALVNSLVNIGVIILAVILLAGVFLAPELVHLVAPGFSQEKQAMVISLMRVMFLSPLFFGLSNLAGGILNSFKNFIVYAIAPILYNLGIIVGALYLVPKFGYIGLAYGVVLGALLHMLIQIPGVFSLGYKYRMHIDWKHSALKKMAGLMVPRTIGIGVNQINEVVNTAIASTLVWQHAVSTFRWADNIASLPISIFGVSFAVAVFPTLAEKYSLSRLDEFKDDVVRVLRQIAFFVVPTMMLYWVLRAQVVRLILGYGEFNWDFTRFTVSALAFFTFGMLAQAAVHLLARSFFALHNTKTPLVVAVGTLIVNVGLALWLGPKFGVVGLAGAISLAALFEAIVLLGLLSKELGGMPWRAMSVYALQIVTASLVCGGAAYLMLRVMNLIVTTHTFWGILAQTLVTIFVAVLGYLAVAKLLKIPETKMLIAPIQRFTAGWRR
jgi:putative peptidoglycan lipid II flippase